MTSELKIKDLPADDTLTELRASELGQVKGGNELQERLTAVFSNPATQINYRKQGNVGVVQVVLAPPGSIVQQSVDQYGALQAVVAPL